MRLTSVECYFVSLLHYAYLLYVIGKVTISETSKKQKGEISKIIKRYFRFVANRGVNLRGKYGLNKERNHMTTMH